MLSRVRHHSKHFPFPSNCGGGWTMEQGSKLPKSHSCSTGNPRFKPIGPPPSLRYKVCSKLRLCGCLVIKSVRFFCNPRILQSPQTVAHQAPPSLGFSRQEHWSGLPFPSPTQESEKWKWSRSVVSDSLRPHGLQPTRLLRPRDFPGKSTGVGCHCLLRLNH